VTGAVICFFLGETFGSPDGGEGQEDCDEGHREGGEGGHGRVRLDDDEDACFEVDGD